MPEPSHLLAGGSVVPRHDITTVRGPDYYTEEFTGLTILTLFVCGMSAWEREVCRVGGSHCD